jgi:hypothetical protein
MGIILEGYRTDVCTLWLMIELFADGKAGMEARVHRHTSSRLFRLLRAAIDQIRSSEPIVLAPEDVGKCFVLLRSLIQPSLLLRADFSSTIRGVGANAPHLG